MANAKELQIAIQAAQSSFIELQNEYPELRPYLAFNCPQGWLPVEVDPRRMLEKLPSMIVDNSAKDAGRDIMAAIEELKQRPAADGRQAQVDKARNIKEKESQLAGALERLTYSDETTIEIRFARLECNGIWPAETAEQAESPPFHSKHSAFRVVLGTVGELCEKYRSYSARNTAG